MTTITKDPCSQRSQVDDNAEVGEGALQPVNTEGDREIGSEFSAFGPLQKLLLAYAASISATFSGLSSFIYYPAITALSESLHVSIEAINLTITAYLVTSGIAPAFLGDLADRMGRRPITILAMTLCFTANLGLAIQNKYAALLILRCLQSAGASSTVALAYGVIADVSTPAERGFYMAILMVLDLVDFDYYHEHN